MTSRNKMAKARTSYNSAALKDENRMKYVNFYDQRSRQRGKRELRRMEEEGE